MLRQPLEGYADVKIALYSNCFFQEENIKTILMNPNIASVQTNEEGEKQVKQRSQQNFSVGCTINIQLQLFGLLDWFETYTYNS